MKHHATIAIIGRPNVGKSTLFNRLTGKRTALVSDMPGLTRDRREGVAQFGALKLRLLDTAGLEDASEGSIAARMREQSELAIKDADVVLFMIDARAGLTGADEEFARMVRISSKPIILIANKTEGKAADAGLLDAYSLGLGEPLATSAEHGLGIGELAEEVARALGREDDFNRYADDDDGRGRGGADDGRGDDGGGAETQEHDEPDDPARPIKLAIVGRPNAGKSTLVNALLGQDRMITGPEPGLTRDSISSELTWQGRQIDLFDTAGLRRKARINERAEKLSASDAIRALNFAEVVVLMVDATCPFEHQDLTIGDMVTQEGRALVIAVNKWDLVEDKQARLKELRELLDEKLAQVQGVPMVTISAIAGRGLGKLMKAVLSIHKIWNRRIATNDLNGWLIEAVQRHAPPASSGRRIKLRFMTQSNARPPTFVVFCSRPDGLPKSYVRYLVNGLRTSFGFAGVPIRLHLRKGKNPYADK